MVKDKLSGDELIRYLSMGQTRTPTPSAPMRYPIQTGLMQAIEWLLSTPSIPLIMRRQFFVLWETVVFGNYEKRDIQYLMSKFREWCILLKWYIPEQKWGNVLVYQDEGDKNSKMELDLNILLNMLTQLYFVNLTRGKDGFTVKEMTTLRSITKSESGKEIKKGSIRLF